MMRRLVQSTRLRSRPAGGRVPVDRALQGTEVEAGHRDGNYYYSRDYGPDEKAEQEGVRAPSGSRHSR